MSRRGCFTPDLDIFVVDVEVRLVLLSRGTVFILICLFHEASDSFVL